MSASIREIDKVEITTLQDNYIDLTSRDNTTVVTRAVPLKGMEVRNSVLAEHGFCALVTITAGDASRNILFDFGFSAHGAAFNAEALSLDLKPVEACVLSHGHLDHAGGIEALARLIGRGGVPLVLHPEAFRAPRYIKFSEEFKVFFPPLTREGVKKAGLKAVETREPYPLLDGAALFLGQIPRTTDFEKGVANFYYKEGDVEKWDDVIDDSSIIMNVKGKGLVVLSGCAHAGIVNTVDYAQRVTGIREIFAVMGGFHLGGPEMGPVVKATSDSLRKFGPTYVVPTHCTGRQAVMTLEKDMPERFILNMSGTKLTFAA